MSWESRIGTAERGGGESSGGVVGEDGWSVHARLRKIIRFALTQLRDDDEVSRLAYHDNGSENYEQDCVYEAEA